jgi:chaperonin GroEL (HSP60 family)
MGVARNICLDPRLVPGGGTCEMAVSRGLENNAQTLVGVLVMTVASHSERTVMFCEHAFV